MVAVPSPIEHSCMEHGRLIEAAAATTNSWGAGRQPLCICTAHIALHRFVTIDTRFPPFTRSASNEVDALIINGQLQGLSNAGLYSPVGQKRRVVFTHSSYVVAAFHNHVRVFLLALNLQCGLVTVTAQQSAAVPSVAIRHVSSYVQWVLNLLPVLITPS